MSLRPSDDERTRAVNLLFGWGIAGVLVAVLGMLSTWPAAWYMQASSASVWWTGVEQYINLLVNQPQAVYAEYRRWFDTEWATNHRPPISWIVALSAGGAVLLAGVVRNPFSFANTEHGSARFATKRDLKRAGLFAETGIVLGRWGNSFKLIRNWETLSALVIAPPGTGKSVGLMANILADWPDRVRARLFGLPLPWKRKAPVPGPCMIINDPKGELYDATAGWRSRIGPVFVLNWADPKTSHRWNDLSPVAYEGGEACQSKRREVIDRLGQVYAEPADAILGVMKLQQDFGGTWAEHWFDNPDIIAPLKAEMSLEESKEVAQGLAEDVDELQALMSAREQHIDRLTTIYIPDSVEQHWKVTGRSFLGGAIGYIIAHCERLGEEPNFGLLLDKLNATSIGGMGFRDPVMREAGPAATGEDAVHEMAIAGLGHNEHDATGGDADEDMTKAIIQEWIDECIMYGYPSRIANDLQETLIKPPNERGSVVSTAGSSINIFKNAAVRAVTSGCSFRLQDLRGIEGRPITLYVRNKLSDAEVFGRVTGALFESIAAWGISQHEKEIKKSRPILMMADEFWTLPPLQALLQIPALGRGQWFQLIVVGQSEGQIATKYRQMGGDAVVKTLTGSMSYKINLTQTDLSSAESISKAIGNKTVRQDSVSRKSGVDLSGLFSNQGWGGGDSGSTNTSYAGRPLLSVDRLMSMPKLDPRKGEWGWQIVQVLGMMNRPIECRPVAWFKRSFLKGPRSPYRNRGGLKVKKWTVVDPTDSSAANNNAREHRRVA